MREGEKGAGKRAAGEGNMIRTPIQYTPRNAHIASDIWPMRFDAKSGILESGISAVAGGQSYVGG